MVELDLVVENIRRKFSKGCPSGIMIGWDVSRFFSALKSVFKGYTVLNQTDFNYSYCNTYDVNLGNNASGHYFVLTIKVSYIYDAFTMHITRYISRRSGEVVTFDQCNEYKELVEKVRSFLADKAFREIQSDEMDVEVEGVELELAEVPTVGKCLFDDFE
ncbi:hypothetical protein [Microbulbifer halophilus]|uniref:Uncharacterized protein n=1 Tax=Microbulbifer halophilus TaxID=453963 RepID=A0ABW5EJZ3_9GAMM|nr:hypothetical protein [Microbulbifer halophilus]MCW8127426.1 hypothetical protein [Microbulbifer halophilus]